MSPASINFHLSFGLVALSSFLVGFIAALDLLCNMCCSGIGPSAGKLDFQSRTAAATLSETSFSFACGFS